MPYPPDYYNDNYNPNGYTKSKKRISREEIVKIIGSIIAILLILFAWYLLTKNKEPIANIVADNTVIGEGDFVNFNAIYSIDLDGEIEEYRWDFGDGTHDSKQITLHQYKEIGNYTVKLKVIDDDGESDETTIRITVQKSIILKVTFQEYKQGILEPDYYFIQGLVTNNGLKTVNLEWGTTYFWITSNSTEYKGRLADASGITIPSHESGHIEIKFQNFPEEEKPEDLKFEYDNYYKDKVKL